MVVGGCDCCGHGYYFVQKGAERLFEEEPEDVVVVEEVVAESQGGRGDRKSEMPRHHIKNTQPQKKKLLFVSLGGDGRVLVKSHTHSTTASPFAAPAPTTFEAFFNDR